MDKSDMGGLGMGFWMGSHSNARLGPFIMLVLQILISVFSCSMFLFSNFLSPLLYRCVTGWTLKKLEQSFSLAKIYEAKFNHAIQKQDCFKDLYNSGARP